MVEIFKDNVRRGQRGVAAEVNLMQRGEPTQLITLIGADKKGGLRLVVLLRHTQQRVVR